MAIIGGRRKKEILDEPRIINHYGDVVSLIKENNLTDNTGRLDIEKLINEIDNLILIKEDLPMEVSGKLEKDNFNNWKIVVNTNHHRRRQRFTIAHELAHYILHRYKNKNFQDKTLFRRNERNMIEVQANIFATKLLMQDAYLYKALKHDIVKTEEIADLFDVPIQVLEIRIKHITGII